MVLDVTYFGVGAGITALLVAFVVPGVSYPRTWVLLGGLWALLPTVVTELPIDAGPLSFVFESRIADVFWFHYSITQFDVETGPLRSTDAIAGVAVAFMLLAICVAEYRQYRTPDAVRERL